MPWLLIVCTIGAFVGILISHVIKVIRDLRTEVQLLTDELVKKYELHGDKIYFYSPCGGSINIRLMAKGK